MDAAQSTPRSTRASSRSETKETTPCPLTERQLQILALVAEGTSNRTIGAQIGLSSQTVKNHMLSVLRKLDAPDRTAAVVVALRQGWLDLRGLHPVIRTPAAFGAGTANQRKSA
jgi:DNA-binding NarL/FixJ family response regulator